ncbi:hypothetical protein UFOVP307_21 [uncultured Caudovirales phage]|uniref:Uncharacterized protein n=1 Tax=uncultured Caudovirales phage TaxID=2100421 RepID=A0A6J5LY84_9CAUD|nr:hypothetical protein UFOVP307_21 [uncultured Caudovirales phage]
MAENIVAGLFGLTPQMYQNQQYNQDLKRGYELAQLSPGAAAQAGLQASVGQLGRGFAGAMGIEDPQLKLISTRNTIAQQIDQTNPESILQGAQMLAQAGDQQGAMALAQYARQAQSEMAQTQQRRAAQTASLATAAKTQLSIDQETKLRDELSKLPQGSTQDDVLSVLTKYGSPDRVIAALTASASKTEATQAKIEASKTANDAALERARLAADAKIEAAKEAGATRLQVAQLQADAKRDIAQLAASLKEGANAELLTPKEKQKREAAYPQATSAINSFETKADSFVKDIEKLRDSPGLSEITGFAAGRLPGVTANGRAAQALYDKIVAKGGFQALQDLRDASKTGGALGNVSNQEGKQLTASFAAIDRRQDAKDVKAALDQAIDDIQGSKTRLKEAYDMTYSYKAEQPKKNLSGEDQQAMDWANKNPNDPRSAQIKNRLGVK